MTLPTIANGMLSYHHVYRPQQTNIQVNPHPLFGLFLFVPTQFQNVQSGSIKQEQGGWCSLVRLPVSNHIVPWNLHILFHSHFFVQHHLYLTVFQKTCPPNGPAHVASFKIIFALRRGSRNLVNTCDVEVADIVSSSPNSCIQQLNGLVSNRHITGSREHRKA